MFASGSRTKNIIVRQSMTHRQLPLLSTATLTPTTTMTQRSARHISSIGDESRIGATLSTRQLSPQMRSKFTERKPTSISTTTTAATTHARNQMQTSSASNSNQTNLYKTNAHPIAVAAGSGNAQGDGRRVMRGIPSNTAARATARQRREATAKGIDTTVKKIDIVVQVNKTEIGIQTNEPEILNHDLIIGDIKLLPPTACLLAEIERQRNELNKKLMLKAKRKFEDHSEKQEEHLTDLKEFLEKSVVTRRSRKSKVSIEVDKK